MKFSIVGLVLATIAQVSMSMPYPQAKKSSPTDACNIGYCTMNGGTTGGAGGTTVTVTTLDALKAAAQGDKKTIIFIKGSITGADFVIVGSNKSILGVDSSAELVGIGLRIWNRKNVIVRNLKISKVLFKYGDAIGILKSTNIWIDHVDLSSDKDHDKDYYDGLIDITHACDWVTVSNSHLHHHWKSVLVGHSDTNEAEDTNHLTITFAYNYWENLNSRMPSFRFGTGHIFNNFFDSCQYGINSRDGAQLLVENNVFYQVENALYSASGGYAVARGNDFGISSDHCSNGTLTSVPYKYDLVATASTKAMVMGAAGCQLSYSY